MPLTNFVWEHVLVERGGKKGLVGTAVDQDGNLVEVFVTEEVLRHLEIEEKDQWPQ